MKTLKLAFRSILHFRMYSLANIIGLALSLACVITIFRYVYGEFTVDRFNKKIDRIYVTTMESWENQENIVFSGAFQVIPEKNFNDMIQHSGVEIYSHFLILNSQEIFTGNRKYNVTVLVADSNFFKITDYPIISGINNLSDPNSALISESYGRKLFGDENPVGKTFHYLNSNTLTITGIIGQTSTKSSLYFDVVVSLNISSWTRTLQTYLLLNPNVNYRTINKQFESFSEELGRRYQLFPLSKVYFDKKVNITGEQFNRGKFDYIIILLAVGFLILFAGITNYLNIYTVVVLRRGMELSLKKIYGAEGINILLQLLFENLLMTGIGVFLSFFFISSASLFVTDVLQLEQVPDIWFDTILSIVILFSLPVITTLYPFLRHHYSTPVNSMRNIYSLTGHSAIVPTK